MLGTLAACGFQPLGWWPATLIGLAGLIALVAGAPHGGKAALLGWLWGLGHFALGDNWIATAFTFQAKMPASLGWAAVILLAAYLAAYPALAAWLAWVIARPHRRFTPLALLFAMAGGWIVSEWLRGWLFTGFAWNPLAAVALGSFGHPGLAAVLPWLGTYALSGGVLLLAGCWWAGLARGRLDMAAAAWLAAPAALLLQPGHFGAADPAGTIAYTLVQPNISQDTLDDPQFFQDHFLTEAALSGPAAPGLPRAGRIPTARGSASPPLPFRGLAGGGGSPQTPRQDDSPHPNPSPEGEGLGTSNHGATAMRRVVLWPESGVPDYLRDGYPPAFYRNTTFAGDPALARARLAGVIGTDSLLLTGTVDFDVRAGAAGPTIAGARNVVTALDEHGTIIGGYAKAHLVPYGEYLPERAWLAPLGLARLVPGDIDFLAGPGPRTLDLGRWGRAGIQICYEIVFSGQVVDRANRPDYIVNPSNDGWFGAWGPPQHLAQARLRAIEEGLPVLRSTVNGISAVVDADGIVRGAIPRGRPGRLDGVIPPAHPPTLFAQWGNALALAWAALLLAASMVATRRQRS